MATPRKLLIIDDDRTFCGLAREFFRDEEFETLVAHSRADALSITSRVSVDVCVLDQWLPDGNGAALCPEILASSERTKIIFISASPDVDSAISAVRLGADDYLQKPVDPHVLRMAVRRAFRVSALERAESANRSRRTFASKHHALIGTDSGLASVAELAQLAAGSDAPVLLTGETGVGKEVVARSIHYKSPRTANPFTTVNAAAMPESLIEAELFGFERGTFTGAHQSTPGLLEAADGGTLFLDEIGEMPIHLQSKLLSVLDSGMVRRLGARRELPVDVRILSATNVDLERAVEEHRFRADLFYRLSVLRICIPPLRERRQDLPSLCQHFLHQLAPERGARLAPGELERLGEHDFPGNVRELRNLLERTLLVQQGSEIRPSRELPPRRHSLPSASRNLQERSLEDVQEEMIRAAVSRAGGNFTRAAEDLGISLSTLKRRVKKYGLNARGHQRVTGSD